MNSLVLCALLVSFVVVCESCCKVHSVGTCCGNGKCNIFCCNCDGGCDGGCETNFDSFIGAAGAAAGFAALGRRKRAITSIADHENKIQNAMKRFAAIDTNHDGQICLEEALAFLKMESELNNATKEKPEWFTSMDKDSDGFVNPSEMSNFLKK